MNKVDPMYGDSVPEVFSTDNLGIVFNDNNDDQEEETDVVELILTSISVLICIVFFPISWFFCLMIVSEYERSVVFRLGKIKSGGSRGPGIIWILPCLDNVVIVDLRTGVYDIPSQDVITKDSVTISVDAVVFYRVTSPLLAVCGDGDYRVTTRYKSQTVIRNVLGTRNLTQILNDRDGVSEEMIDNLQTGVNKIGVKVDRIELKQIGLPHKMQRNMASEAEAKVQSKAKMVTSEGEAEANNRLVEAGDSLGVVSLHLRYLQTMIRINQPPNVNHGYILPFPLEMLKLKKSFVNSGYDLVDQLIKGMNLKLMETVDNDLTNNPEAKTKKRRKRRKNNED